MAMGESMKCGGATAEVAAATSPSLVRRWTELKGRTSRFSSSILHRVDRQSLLDLNLALDDFEAQLVPLGNVGDKLLGEVRDAIDQIRLMIQSCPGMHESPEPCGDDIFDADDLAGATAPEFSREDQEAVEEFKVGSVISPSERYQGVRTLRSTLQGKVVFGLNRRTGAPVALKLCLKSAVERHESLAGDKVLEDPMNEARMMTILSDPGHDSVIRLIDCLEDDVHHWMVLEFADRGEFFDIVSEAGRLEEQVAAQYFRQLTQALEYIHSREICHLDLSLENILLDKSGHLKVADFGLARRFEPQTPFPPSLTSKPGKTAYMAPEIFSGKPFFGSAADIYSAGVILFVMLFGCPPYELPVLSDRRFRLMYCGEIHELLRRWHMSASALAIDLLSGMLCSPDDRLTVREILDHPWLAQDPIRS